MDIEYSKKSIINKINSYFGYVAVEKLKIIAFEKNGKNNLEKFKIGSKKDFSKNLKNIKNTNLKNALIDLVKSYKQ